MPALFPVWVGLRYSVARKGNLLLSFVTLLSMLGVSLGVTVLIVAISVMNGSIGVLRAEALKAVPHVTIAAAEGDLAWRGLLELARENPQILAVAPFVESDAVLRFQGRDAFVRLRGVLPEWQAEVVDAPGPVDAQLFASMAEIADGMVLSARLAASLGVFPGAEATVQSLAGLLERDFTGGRGLVAVGFEDFGVYGESNIVLLDLELARGILRQDPGATVRLRLKVADVMAAREIAEASFGELPGLEIRTWREEQASLFNALEMEKLVTGVMLLMIVLIGAVNIVSTLVMAVADKNADIAILRAMGAGRRTVLGIFIVQGMVAGVAGTVTGASLGVVVGRNITAVGQTLEGWLNAVLPGMELFFLPQLQTRVAAGEVLLICSAALLISLAATLYPAWRAGQVRPAEALRHL